MLALLLPFLLLLLLSTHVYIIWEEGISTEKTIFLYCLLHVSVEHFLFELLMYGPIPKWVMMPDCRLI